MRGVVYRKYDASTWTTLDRNLAGPMNIEGLEGTS
jgi:hypothetical protein